MTPEELKAAIDNLNAKFTPEEIERYLGQMAVIVKVCQEAEGSDVSQIVFGEPGSRTVIRRDDKP